jgi:hypothetical protein
VGFLSRNAEEEEFIKVKISYHIEQFFFKIEKNNINGAKDSLQN